MAERPTGTVTFLFTDIEGSTRLWEERPAEMRAALARHDALVRDVVEANQGMVFSTGGDGFGVAFPRASDALAAVRAVQAALAGDALLKVRMGLHTGEAQERDGDYFGPAVNRAARIMSAGHGGQVLVSGTTADLVGTDELLDLGTHRLRDLAAAERLWQLGPGTFPRLRTTDGDRVRIPRYRTSFVGRVRLLDAVARRLEAERLVTLTGVGGVGKTRVAVEVAGRIAHRFATVGFVDLTVVSSPDAVGAALAEAVDVELQPGMLADRAAAVAIGGRPVLMVVDNAEHVVRAVADLVERLLDDCEQLVVLVTSRERLRLAGEHVVQVPPLGPDENGSGPSDRWRLLVDRALAVNADLDTSGPNRDALVRIGDELDGLPLALELAAARLAVLTPVQLAGRLGARLDLLGGRRGRTGRHETLRALVQWSYELLDPDARDLFDALSVWPGGCTLDLVVTMTRHDEVATIHLLDELVAKSMLAFEPDTGRYRMLETLRQYGADRLEASGRTEPIRLQWVAALADWVDERVGSLWGEREVPTRDALWAETANIAAACDWSLTARRPEPAARILAALVLEIQFGSDDRLWDLAEQLLDLLPPDSPHLPALSSIVIWASAMRGEVGEAQQWIDRAEAARLAHPAGAWYLLEWGRFCLVGVTSRFAVGELATAHAVEGERALVDVAAGALAAGRPQLATVAEASIAYTLYWQGRLGDAATAARRALDRADGCKAGFARAWALAALARALDEIDPAEAARLADEASTLARRHRATFTAEGAERTLARALTAGGAIDDAAAHLLGSFHEDQASRFVSMQAYTFVYLAGLLVRSGQLVDAAMALGISHEGLGIEQAATAVQDRALTRARRAVEAALGATQVERLARVGANMGDRQAITWATEILTTMAKAAPEAD